VIDTDSQMEVSHSKALRWLDLLNVMRQLLRDFIFQLGWNPSDAYERSGYRGEDGSLILSGGSALRLLSQRRREDCHCLLHI
jgi:hypothetical protein